MANSLMTTSPFLGGLNTELNGVTDSTEFTRDELNMMVRQDNTRSRRPGVDYEELFKFNKEIIPTDIPNLAFNCIEWTDINSPDEAQTYDQTPYIVCQVGGTIIFFKNEGAPYSINQNEFTLDLAQYRLDTSDDTSYKTERCKFTTAYGCLFITSKAIKPIRLRRAQKEEEEWTPTSTLPTCRVSCSIFCGKRSSNYGRAFCWGVYFKINGVEIARLSYEQHRQRFYPISHDWYLAKTGQTSTQYAAWFNELPAETRLGITATPRYNNAYPTWDGLIDDNGNYLGRGSYTQPDDWITFTAPAGSELSYRGYTVEFGFNGEVKKSSWDVLNKGTFAGGTAYTNSSGMELTIRDTTIGADDYLAIDSQPEKISYAHLYNLYNQGWNNSTIASYYVNQSPEAFPGNNLAVQYMKDTKTEKFKPTTAINLALGDTPAARGHFKLAFFDQKRAQVANISNGMTTLVTAINDAYAAKGSATRKTLEDILDTTIPNPTDPLKQVPNVKPRRPFVTDLCAYAGRIFYLCGDVLLYSQIISEDIRRASYCYSEADPTSQEISDVVETDGGHISLPEIGEGIKLQQFGTYLLVFGSRGNMLITGTANNNFTATAYTTGTLPVAPTQSPYSFVETEYGIFYWGTTGITLVSAGENGISSKDVSTDRILTWYGRLTNKQHEHCKGVYSSAKKKIYWFYPSNEDLPRCLDRLLVYDINKNAFMPHEITKVIYGDNQEVTLNNLPEIVSGLPLKVPFKNVKEYPVEIEGNYLRNWYGYENEFNGVATSDYFTLDKEEAVVSENVYVQATGSTTKTLLGSISDVLTYTHTAGSTTTVEGYITVRVSYGSGETQTFSEATRTVGETTVKYYYNGTHVFDENGVFIGKITSDVTASITFTDYRDDTSVTATKTANTKTLSMKPVVLKRDSEEDYQETVEDEATYEVLDDEGIKILADDPIESEEFTYESSLLLCFDINNAKVTFGDFRNNNMRDWTAGDWEGSGYLFDSYLISHPMNAVSGGPDIVHRKNMPYLISYFKRTETGNLIGGGYVYPSKCQGSVLWDWRTNGDFGKWDSPQELYRPNKREIFSEGYVVTKTNIRGLGRAYQVKLESVEDNQLIVEALCSDLMNDGRI